MNENKSMRRPETGAASVSTSSQHYAPNDRAVSLAGGRRRESALAFDWTGFEARDFWQGQNTVTT